MDSNWRAALTQESRHKIINRIRDTLQRHMTFSGQEGLNDISRIAARFEEKILYAATDQHDYLRKISLKMLNLETLAQDARNGALPASSNVTVQSSSQPFDSSAYSHASGVGDEMMVDGFSSDTRRHSINKVADVVTPSTDGEKVNLGEEMTGHSKKKATHVVAGDNTLYHSKGNLREGITSIEKPIVKSRKKSAKTSLGFGDDDGKLEEGIPAPNSPMTLEKNTIKVPKTQSLEVDDQPPAKSPAKSPMPKAKSPATRKSPRAKSPMPEAKSPAKSRKSACTRKSGTLKKHLAGDAAEESDKDDALLQDFVAPKKGKPSKKKMCV